MHSLVCLVVFFSMVSIIGTQLLPCDVELSNLKFTLFTRQTPANGVDLKDQSMYSSVDPNIPTKVIIHGLLESSNTPWVTIMKNTYLVKMNANIITIDYSPYAGILYNKPLCTVPYVGSLVGDLISNLVLSRGLNLATVQINGYALGAHVAGATGQRVFALRNLKIGRINGLEATSLGFLGIPINQRLDATDAVFVQAIHTNNQRVVVGLGYPERYGTIDFEVNYNLILQCGSVQPGCPLNPGVDNDGQLVNGVLPTVLCYQIRVIAYFIESINSLNFLGVQCNSCTLFGTGLCSSNPKTIMGEMCPSTQAGVRYLNTNAASPFAQG